MNHFHNGVNGDPSHIRAFLFSPTLLLSHTPIVQENLLKNETSQLKTLEAILVMK